MLKHIYTFYDSSTGLSTDTGKLLCKIESAVEIDFMDVYALTRAIAKQTVGVNHIACFYRQVKNKLHFSNN